jgi:hypothetical protein
MAEIDEKHDRSVRIPTFDGSEDQFQIWWIRFKAYARVMQFSEAIETGGEADLPISDAASIDMKTEEGKRQAKAKKRNNVAIANFTMAFTTESSIQLLFKSQTAEWPGGLAHLVVKELMAVYMPQDTVTRSELRQMLNRVSMKTKEHPRVIFEQISKIQNRFTTVTGKQIDKEDLIGVVIDAATLEYKSVITSGQRAQGSNLTLQKLESAMTQLYRSIHTTTSDPENKKEMTLGAFGGICYQCHKSGHKASECPQRGKTGSG